MRVERRTGYEQLQKALGSCCPQELGLSPQRPRLGLPAQSESPSFLRGKLKQALKLCPPGDKEPEDCKVPPRPFEDEGVQLQGGTNEVLCSGCWRRGDGEKGLILFRGNLDPKVQSVLWV